jgi:glutamate/tyrosine decarboxylase-like PLP-dependent enzyme
MDQADSLVMDPHKTLFLPYGTGAVLVRDRQRLLATHHSAGGYMQDALEATEILSPADTSPELTRHFRGLRLWLPLVIAGVAPFRAALEEKLLLARYFHERLREVAGFEVGPPPELSVAIYRYVPRRGNANAFNARLVEALQRDGRVFVSSTMVGDKFVLRAAIVNFRTHLDHVDAALKILEETAHDLEES